MRFDVLTLFPEFFLSPLKQSIIGKAIDKGLIEARLTNIRDFATDKHRTTDDAPYGGGAGMVMKVEPLALAIEAARENAGGSKGSVRVLLTSPKGVPLTQRLAEELSELESIIIVCGRYEGVDERVRAFVDMEVSLGDYIMTGGEVAALAIIETVGRLKPGVLSNVESIESESFSTHSEGMLEYPQYTRPEEFRGMRVPEVLVGGNHAEIDKWRRAESLKITEKRRPELASSKKRSG